MVDGEAVGRLPYGRESVEGLGAASIQSIELVAACEEAFDIEMDQDEALGVKTVGDAVAFITKVVAEQHG